MALERSDRLKAPPVLGRWYLVPTVFFAWRKFSGSPLEGEGCQWWPVWGLKHDDIEHFDFPNQHYHVDPRFLTKRHWRHFGRGSRTKLADVQATPLNSARLPDGPPKPVLRRMRCSMVHAQWRHHDAVTVDKLNRALAGQQCAKGKRGFVCPHKLFPLGSIEALDGVITCPLHGLRIDAETGKCLGPTPQQPAEVIKASFTPVHSDMPRGRG